MQAEIKRKLMTKGGEIKMEILIVINDANYGTEKAYNALRTAINLQKKSEDIQVNIFLLADAVSCAIANQDTPQGYYNIEVMLKNVLRNSGKVKACGTCANARGLADVSLVKGVEKSNMNEFTQWIVDADKILTF